MDCLPLWQQSHTRGAMLEVGVGTTLVGEITLGEMVAPELPGAITLGEMVAPVLGVLLLGEAVEGRHLEGGFL